MGDRSNRRRALQWGVLLLVALVLPLAPTGTDALTNHTAVQGGRWDDPATWGGAVPASADAAIVIPANVSVSIPADLAVPLAGGSIQLDGFLFVGGHLDLDRTDITNATGGELWLIAGRVDLTGTSADRARVTNAGKLGNSGGQVFLSSGTDLVNTGTIINDGPMVVGVGSTVLNQGVVRNTGRINVNGIDSDAGTSRGVFRNTGGTIVNTATITTGGQLTNGGPTTSPSIIDNQGTINVIGGTSAGLLYLTGTAPAMIENRGEIAIMNELVSDQSGPTQGLHNHPGAQLVLRTPWSAFYTGILRNDAGALIAIGNVAKLMNQTVIDNDGEIVNENILYNARLIRWRCNATFSGNAVQGNPPTDWCDHAPPDIEVPQSLTVEATGPNGAVVQFITPVKDDKDPSPDVSCTPLSSGDEFPLGSTTVTCTATDYVGNDTSASFVVQVVDTLPATMSLRGEPIDVVVEDNQYVDDGATASDTVDGDISGDIVVTGAVDTATPGTYQLTYTVEDSSGNTTTLTRTVEVITPAAATSNLIDDVDALAIPARHRDELRRYLTRAESLLADSNTSNDRGACELLEQFDGSVERKRGDGVLTTSDAAHLLDSSGAIMKGAC